MSRKQIKLSVNKDLYKQLSEEAEERNLPISTFARLLISRQLELEEKQLPPRQKVEEVEDDNEDSFRSSEGSEEGVIMLSDVLKQQSDEKEDHKSLSQSKSTEGVNISIVINK